MDLVKVSRADITWLYPGDAGGRGRRCCPPWSRVCGRDPGRGGAAGVSAEDVVSAPGIQVAVSRPRAAGDAFTSGLLARLREHGLLERDTLRHLPTTAIEDALAFANRVAASACTRSGAEPPTRAALDAGARRH